MAQNKSAGKKRKEGIFLQIQPKAISQARNDIATWKAALRQALSVESPRRIKIQNLYKDITVDALLSSQIDNRRLQTLSAEFSLKDLNGNINEDATAILKSSRYFYEITRNILDSIFFGTTVIEILNMDFGVRIVTIPRNNIEPRDGILLLDENDSKGIPYRTMKEYGTWVLEFGDKDDLGLLNKAIPHVLFKRFAESCWSELCEIYGIPPRVMKTNTQDPIMLTRAEAMMRDMGAAAWYIIDETESFEFAKGADTNGDVYNNLIRLCNNENSMLISGAIVGQDTKHGNESKEEVSVHMLSRLIESDKRLVENYWNESVLQALFRIGLMPDSLALSFDPQEDINQLWTMTKDILPFMDVDPQWVKAKFGIEVVGKKIQPQQQLSGFFD